MQSRIEEISKEFFTLMGLTLESVTVECQDEKKGIYLIHIKTPDSKLVIGIHGQTLEMTKHLLTRMLEKTLGESLLIHLEVNDYLQSRDEKFFRYLDSRVEYAMRVGGEITLPNLTSYERKKAHGYISDKAIENLKTFSVGEGKERALHLSYSGTPTGHKREESTVSTTAPKKITMTIDDEGVGI